MMDLNKLLQPAARNWGVAAERMPQKQLFRLLPFKRALAWYLRHFADTLDGHQTWAFFGTVPPNMDPDQVIIPAMQRGVDAINDYIEDVKIERKL